MLVQEVTAAVYGQNKSAVRVRIHVADHKPQGSLLLLLQIPYGCLFGTELVGLVCRYGSGGNPDYTNDYLGPLSNCTDFSGSMPGLAENLVYDFNNSDQTFSRKPLFIISTALLPLPSTDSSLYSSSLLLLQ